MSELRKFLSGKQCDLLYRELQNFAPHVCSVKGATELIVYNFLLTKTVYFRKVSERITLEYVRRGHSSHCIRAFPRTRQAFYYALKRLEKRGVVTITQTDNPNWYEVRLELPGLLSCILSAPVGYENKKYRELLLFAHDRLKRWWEAQKWKLRAVQLRPEIEKLQIDIFDEPPKEQVAEDRKLDRIRKKIHRLCLKHQIDFAWGVSGDTMTRTISNGYEQHFAYCKEHRMDADTELETMVEAWPAFVASKPKNEKGVRFSISKRLRMSDFFIYYEALRRFKRDRPESGYNVRIEWEEAGNDVPDEREDEQEVEFLDG